jgi:hypothetical protein
MKDTKVIAAFPACGKTYYVENREEDNIVLDSDSSKFSWMNGVDEQHEFKNRGKKNYTEQYIKVRNPNFPNNYIEHIKENIGKVDYIFVSTHDVVRKALKQADIDFTLVFPEQSLKSEWIGRCFLRGSGEEFCQLISDQWDNWMLQMEEEVVVNKRKHYRLKHGEYLSDAMKHI